MESILITLGIVGATAVFTYLYARLERWVRENGENL